VRIFNDNIGAAFGQTVLGGHGHIGQRAPERVKKVSFVVFLVQIEGAGLPIRENGVETFRFGFEQASVVIESFHRIWVFDLMLQEGE
jgi:hypothetical protein